MIIINFELPYTYDIVLLRDVSLGSRRRRRRSVSIEKRFQAFDVFDRVPKDFNLWQTLVRIVARSSFQHLESFVNLMAIVQFFNSHYHNI